MTSKMRHCGVDSHAPLSTEELPDKDETPRILQGTWCLFPTRKKKQLSRSLCRSLEMREQRCPPLRCCLLGKGPAALGCLCQQPQQQLCVTRCSMTGSNLMQRGQLLTCADSGLSVFYFSKGKQRLAPHGPGARSGLGLHLSFCPHDNLCIVTQHRRKWRWVVIFPGPRGCEEQRVAFECRPGYASDVGAGNQTQLPWKSSVHFQPPSPLSSPVFCVLLFVACISPVQAVRTWELHIIRLVLF